jgi:micrococcal nuclease
MFEYNAKLIRTIDGDTIDAEIDIGFGVFVKKRIRLYGIDTWESRTKDLEEKKKGLAAKARLIEILEDNGNKFVLQSHELGKYGRVLGSIILDDDRDACDILLEEGHAYSYDGGNKQEARDRAAAILAEKENE